MELRSKKHWLKHCSKCSRTNASNKLYCLRIRVAYYFLKFRIWTKKSYWNDKSSEIDNFWYFLTKKTDWNPLNSIFSVDPWKVFIENHYFKCTRAIACDKLSYFLNLRMEFFFSNALEFICHFRGAFGAVFLMQIKLLFFNFTKFLFLCVHFSSHAFD